MDKNLKKYVNDNYSDNYREFYIKEILKCSETENTLQSYDIMCNSSEYFISKISQPLKAWVNPSKLCLIVENKDGFKVAMRCLDVIHDFENLCILTLNKLNFQHELFCI
jgi:hypothetical protein